MAKQDKPKEQVIPHRHELKTHDHDLPEHSHPQGSYADLVHTHELIAHNHDTSHQHEQVAHEHKDSRALVVGAVRALLAVLDLGTLNTAQAKAMHAVRVVVGDAHGAGCDHRNTALEAGDVNTCLDCRAVLPAPDPFPNQES